LWAPAYYVAMVCSQLVRYQPYSKMLIVTALKSSCASQSIAICPHDCTLCMMLW